jgi:hypothetical protein
VPAIYDSLLGCSFAVGQMVIFNKRRKENLQSQVLPKKERNCNFLLIMAAIEKYSDDAEMRIHASYHQSYSINLLLWEGGHPSSHSKRWDA